MRIEQFGFSTLSAPLTALSLASIIFRDATRVSIAGCYLGERLLAVQFRAEKRTRAAAAALGSRLGAHGRIYH